MNHAEGFFAAAAQICRDISLGSIEDLASELDRLRAHHGERDRSSAGWTAILRGVTAELIRDCGGLSADAPEFAGKYVAFDVHKVGGIPVILKSLLDGGLLNGDCVTVTGKKQRSLIEDGQDDRELRECDHNDEDSGRRPANRSRSRSP